MAKKATFLPASMAIDGEEAGILADFYGAKIKVARRIAEMMPRKATKERKFAMEAAKKTKMCAKTAYFCRKFRAFYIMSTHSSRGIGVFPGHVWQRRRPFAASPAQLGEAGPTRSAESTSLDAHGFPGQRLRNRFGWCTEKEHTAVADRAALCTGEIGGRRDTAKQDKKVPKCSQRTSFIYISHGEEPRHTNRHFSSFDTPPPGLVAEKFGDDREG